MVVDQPASIGALPVAVARASGCQVAYLPGLTMRRLADLHPGQAKSDARDAFVIAEATRVRNRIRGLLTQIHPDLKRVLGPKANHPAVLELLSRFGGPQRLRQAARRRLLTLARKLAPRMGEQLVDDIVAALDTQTVTVPGSTAAEAVLPRLADSLRTVVDQRKQIATEVERMLDAHPRAQVLTSMPGLGVRTAARVLLEVGDGSSLPTSGHLAAYAGLAPVSRISGTSIRDERPHKGGNKHLNAPCSWPRSRLCPTPPPVPTTNENATRETPQRRPNLPGPPPLRRPVRHAPRRHRLSDPSPSSRLTEPVGTPRGPVGGSQGQPMVSPSGLTTADVR